MKTIAINGSPRKNRNTATLLQNVLDGAQSAGSEVEMIHLYDQPFKGCISCFACKQKNSKHFGHCTVNDGLKPILQKIEEADAVVMGSPLYFTTVTGVMHSFLERFLFQYMLYTQPPSSTWKGNLRLGLIYTMNVSEDVYQTYAARPHLERTEGVMRMLFGNLEVMHCFDTYQMTDYMNIDYTYLDPAKKKIRHETIFPDDCRRAYAMGAQLTEQI
jgi:multimeric flavodoxin WrbA